MNISIYDLFIFLKKKIINSILVFITGFVVFYAYSNLQKTKDQISFQVDLREWGYLNVTTYDWLKPYTKYKDQVKYSVIDSFNSTAKCEIREDITNLLFCSVEGVSLKLNNDFDKFKNQSSLILQKQDLEFKYDITTRLLKIEETKNFIKETSKGLIETGKLELLTDLNYRSYMQLSEMESKVQLLKKIKKDFNEIVLIKNKKLKDGKIVYNFKYGVLFSILCLVMYVIMGLSYNTNYKKKLKKIK